MQKNIIIKLYNFFNTNNFIGFFFVILLSLVGCLKFVHSDGSPTEPK